VEIDIEYRERAKAMGIPYFGRVPTVGTHPLFIEGLADLILAEETTR
jgi:ferrochelatase